MDVIQEFVDDVEKQMNESRIANEWSFAFIAVCTATGEARLATRKFSPLADLAFMAFILQHSMSQVANTKTNIEEQL